MLEIPALKKTCIRRLALLSSVCALAMSLPTNDAQARRLMPSMPSVEVHFEALEALRQSAYAQGQTPGGWITGPEGKIVSAPVGYPAPTPAPVVAKAPPAPKPVVEVAKQVPPAPKPAPQPKQEIAKAPPSPPPAAESARPSEDRPKFAPSAPLALEEELAKAPPPAAEPMPAPVPTAQASAPDLSLPPLSEPASATTPPSPPAEEELASLPPLTPIEPTPAPAPQDAAAALEKELESLPPLTEAEAVTPDVSADLPADLPEPDMKSLEPLPSPSADVPLPPLEEKQAEKKEEKKEEPAEDIKREKKPEDRPMALPEPEKKIIIKAPEEGADAVPSLEDLGLPPLPEETSSAKLEEPPFAEAEKLPEPMPSDASAPVEEVPSAELPALPDAEVPPAPSADAMPPEEEIPAPTKREEVPSAADTKDEEGGMFSGLKGMVKGLLGDEEVEKPAQAPAPAPIEEAAPLPAPEEAPLPELLGAPPSLEGIPDAVPVPEASESEAKKLPDIAPPDALSLEGVPPAESETTAPEGLPSIDDLTSGKNAESDALDFVKEKAGVPAPLPPLPDMKKASSEPTVAVNNAPAPVEEAKEKESVEQQLASIPTPPMEEVTKPASLGGEAATLMIEFAKTETEVPLAAQKPLEELARKLSAPGNTQGVSVVAYASGTEDQASIARRVSLSRALAIRAFLIDAGIDNLRINVQAMGNKAEGGNPERADVFVK